MLGEVEQLVIRIEAIKKQVSAIDQMIAIYDPTHKASSSAKPNRKQARQEVPLPDALAQLSKAAAILEVLREAGEPLSSADCADQDRREARGGPNDPALPRFVTHVSASLNSLMKRNRVRQVGTVDGRKHLWEIVR